MKRPVSLFEFALWFLGTGSLAGFGVGVSIGLWVGDTAATIMAIVAAPIALAAVSKAVDLKVKIAPKKEKP